MTLVVIAGCATMEPRTPPPTPAEIAAAAELDRQARLPLADASCLEVVRRANRPFRTAVDGLIREAAGAELANRCLDWLAEESCSSLTEWASGYYTAVDIIIRDTALDEYAGRCLDWLAEESCDELTEWASVPFRTYVDGSIRDAALDEYAERCL